MTYIPHKVSVIFAAVIMMIFMRVLCRMRWFPHVTRHHTCFVADITKEKSKKNDSWLFVWQNDVQLLFAVKTVLHHNFRIFFPLNWRCMALMVHNQFCDCWLAFNGNNLIRSLQWTMIVEKQFQVFDYDYICSRTEFLLLNHQVWQLFSTFWWRLSLCAMKYTRVHILVEMFTLCYEIYMCTHSGGDVHIVLWNIHVYTFWWRCSHCTVKYTCVQG